MDNTITNLRALIDSGKRENIEMAANLSVNLPDEWQWLHRHCKAKLELTTIVSVLVCRLR
jgi:hypothetical protein